MSTDYGWEGIRQVGATLLGARHVPERLCGGPCLQRGAITSARPLPLTQPNLQTNEPADTWVRYVGQHTKKTGPTFSHATKTDRRFNRRLTRASVVITHLATVRIYVSQLVGSVGARQAGRHAHVEGIHHVNNACTQHTQCRLTLDAYAGILYSTYIQT